jgi:hypothetical protein
MEARPASQSIVLFMMNVARFMTHHSLCSSIIAFIGAAITTGASFVLAKAFYSDYKKPFRA